MNKTITYEHGQPCPDCKPTDKPCKNCGRVRTIGQAVIAVTTSAFEDAFKKLLDPAK